MQEKIPLFALGRDTSVMLRGAAILMVMLTHTNYIPLSVGVGSVALFVFLSGYGLNASCERNGLKDFWHRRMSKVWLPYFFVGLLGILLLRPHGAGAILCTLTGLDFGLIADPTMWYISYIFFWYAVFYLGARLTGGLREPMRYIVLTGWLFLACAPCILLGRTGFWHSESGSLAYLLCFPLGTAISCCRKYRVTHTLYRVFWAACLLAGAVCLLLAVTGLLRQKLLTCMGVALFAIAVLQLVPVSGILKSALLRVGEYSYPLFLFEGLFLTFRRNWAETMPAKWMADLAFFAASAAAAVLYWTIYRAAGKALAGRRA